MSCSLASMPCVDSRYPCVVSALSQIDLIQRFVKENKWLGEKLLETANELSHNEKMHVMVTFFEKEGHNHSLKNDFDFHGKKMVIHSTVQPSWDHERGEMYENISVIFE